MNLDNILVKMPDQLDYFLAAASVLQDYCVQLHKQAAMKQRPFNFMFTVEVADDGYLFFVPMFPRMDLVVQGELPKFAREEWSCIIDFTDIERVSSMAAIPKKHITEMWGIMYGASPQPLPGLGSMLPQPSVAEVDVLIDERVPVTEQMIEYMGMNFPQAKLQVANVEGLRPSTLFGMLANTKIFLGMRSGATYLAATMMKPILELYPDDLPLWFMSKPTVGLNRAFYGSTFSASQVWALLEETYVQVTGVEDNVYAGELL